MSTTTDALRCRGWQQEAALRMLENNLHPDVAEKPEELIVYGGIGKAARDHASYDDDPRASSSGWATTRRCSSSRASRSAVFETHEAAPRVLIANSNLVPEWATWEHFRELDAAGLMMYGQMTAGSWIYIGTQGILQGTYETFAAVARKRFDGTLAGRLVVTAGLGGMGGAQPLAITMCDGARAVRRGRPAADRAPHPLPATSTSAPADLDDALARLEDGASTSAGRCRSACSATPPRSLPELVAPRRATSTSSPTRPRAHDPLNGYVPAGLTVEQADALRARRPRRLPAPGRRERARARGGDPRRCSRAGAEAFDYGNALRGVAAEHGDADAFAYPGLRPRLHPPAVLRGQGPVPLGRAVAATPRTSTRTDDAILELFGDDEHIARWIRAGAREGPLPGAAGAHLLARLRRAPPRRAALQRDGRGRRAEGADRHRPRPPRRRLGRLAPARDRGDARRLRRRRRLADAQRAGQHRVRGELGLGPPRRRRRHGQVDPRRPGRGGRRQRPGGRARAPRADRRPRAGRRPPRRRRLPRGDRRTPAPTARGCRCSTPSPRDGAGQHRGRGPDPAPAGRRAGLPAPRPRRRADARARLDRRWTRA